MNYVHSPVKTYAFIVRKSIVPSTMSHVQSLQSAKSSCDKNCDSYNALLVEQDRQIDLRTARDIQSTTALGSFFLIIGVLLILTPFSKTIVKINRFVIPILAIISPIIVGIIIGAGIGFAISFSACYKQSCSPIEQWAMLLVPLITLIPTIPLTRKIFRSRFAMKEKLNTPKKLTWILIGSFIALIAIYSTASKINSRIEYSELYKQSIRNY